MSCHFHFPVCILSSNEWIPFPSCVLHQECTSPLHPIFLGCVIHVMCHPQRSDSLSQQRAEHQEVPQHSLVGPFGGAVPAMLLCSSTVCHSPHPMGSSGAGGKCLHLLGVLSTMPGPQEMSGSVCSRETRRTRLKTREHLLFMMVSPVRLHTKAPWIFARC